MADVEFLRFKKLLKSSGYFVTRPRMSLFGYLQKHPSLTIKELIHLSKAYDQVTVYRNIDVFEKLGIINKLQLGWHTKIELSDIFYHHHHHLSCVRCARTWALKEDRTLESRISGIVAVRKFKIIDHQLEIRGLCPRCQGLTSSK